MEEKTRKIEKETGDLPKWFKYMFSAVAIIGTIIAIVVAFV